MSALHRVRSDPRFEDDEDGVLVTLAVGTKDEEICIHLSWARFIRAVEGGRRFIAERDRKKAPVLRFTRRKANPA